MKTRSRAVEVKVVTLRETRPLKPCNSSGDLAEFWRGQVMSASWYRPDQECLVVLLLNGRNQIKNFSLVHLGSCDSVYCEPRDVYRLAVARAARRILLVHNHPSGEITPSREDIHATRRLAAAGEVLGIELVDHLIISEPCRDPAPPGYYSMRGAGYLKELPESI